VVSFCSMGGGVWGYFLFFDFFLGWVGGVWGGGGGGLVVVAVVDFGESLCVVSGWVGFWARGVVSFFLV